MINEEALANARQAGRQDKGTPFLINIKDLRLVPNTKLTAKLENYRPYTGDIKASEADRARYVSGFTSTRGVIIPSVEDAFDVSKASADELVAFALDEYGAALDGTKSLKALREDVVKLAKAAGAAIEAKK